MCLIDTWFTNNKTMYVTGPMIKICIWLVQYLAKTKGSLVFLSIIPNIYTEMYTILV